MCKPGRGLVARGLPLGGELPLSWAELQAAVFLTVTLAAAAFPWDAVGWRSIGS